MTRTANRETGVHRLLWANACSQSNRIGDGAMTAPMSGRYERDVHLSVRGIAKVRYGSEAAIGR